MLVERSSRLDDASSGTLSHPDAAIIAADMYYHDPWTFQLNMLKRQILRQGTVATSFLAKNKEKLELGPVAGVLLIDL